MSKTDAYFYFQMFLSIWIIILSKVYSKECDEGTYGFSCEQFCSGHCVEGLSCNREDGRCLRGCEDGWINSKCDETCKIGYYGRNCSRTCGHCARNAACYHVNGICPSGLCESGWKHTSERRYDQECDNGTFGWYCMSTCSGHCALGLACNKVNGSCLGGCAYGWITHRCNESCTPGWYGRECKEQCGYCDGNMTCHHDTGFCPGLCQPGYHGKRCNELCPDGTYGAECKLKCSEGCLSVCDKKNGTCEKCREGYAGAFCIDAHALQRRMTSILEVAGITTSVACFSILFALVLRRERLAAM